MRILITGSHGLIGSALSSHFESGGHEVIPLHRKQGVAPCWDPDKGEIDLTGVGDLDVVIHLAGDNIASARWSADKKKRIRESRVNGTELLCEALAGLPRLPKTLICGSAIGFYGNRGDETLTEESQAGTGFFPTVVSDWEAATEAAEDVGIRVVHIRTGVVLSPDGGALKKMLLPFKLCLGGVVGSGKQFFSWIDIRDEISAVEFLIQHEEISGPVNLTAPAPVTNYELTKTLGAALRRPTLIPMPAFLCKLLMGEMGETLLLGGSKVQPEKLLQAGYSFRYPRLKDSIESLV